MKIIPKEIISKKNKVIDKVFLLIILSTILYGSQYFNENKSLLLNAKYKAHSLIGDANTKEKLVIDFNNVDCFTFIDSIEALKGSDNLEEFKTKLIFIRYKNSKISYKTRKHFFSDWVMFNPNIKDVTCTLGICKKTTKYLNEKTNGEVYIKDIPIVKRVIYYIEPKDIELSKLKDGDYIGIYTKIDGLDVTHTGLIVLKNGLVYLRHASSIQKKVVDVLFSDYTFGKGGIVIYRNIK